jgi:hypothetical protein
LVDSLRPHVLSHPLLLFALCFVIHKALARKVADASTAKLPTTWVFSALFLTILCLNVAVSAYVDHVEPSVAALSWAVMRGEEAYPPPDATAIYGLPYGPMLFLLYGAVLKIVGPAISVSKLGPALASAASLVLVAIAGRRAFGGRWPRVLRWTAIVYLAFGAAAFWLRAEPLLMLCGSLAALALTLPPTPAAVVFGLALGVGINLKISAFVYLLPAVAVMLRKYGITAVALATAVAVVAAALPFVLFENISASGYLYWVRTTAGHGFRLRALLSVLEWAAFVSIPLGLLARGQDQHSRVLSWMLLLTIFASVPLATKHGTGVYHFLPFVPLILFAAAGRGEVLPSRLGPFLAAGLVLAAFQISQWIVVSTGLPAREILGELRRMEQSSGGTVAMGYSVNYRNSFFRPPLVFDGHPNVLDGASAMDAAWSGRPFPRALVDAMRSCAVANWIIPSGGAPFELPNAYGEAEVFPAEFRQAFHERYQLRESGRWYDLWTCGR